MLAPGILRSCLRHGRHPDRNRPDGGLKTWNRVLGILYRNRYYTGIWLEEKDRDMDMYMYICIYKYPVTVPISRLKSISTSTYIYIHTHTHTHIYIYIYITMVVKLNRLQGPMLQG